MVAVVIAPASPALEVLGVHRECLPCRVGWLLSSITIYRDSVCCQARPVLCRRVGAPRAAPQCHRSVGRYRVRMRLVSAQRLACAAASLALVVACQSSSVDGSPTATVAGDASPSSTPIPTSSPTDPESPAATTSAPGLAGEAIAQVLVEELRVREAPSVDSDVVALLSSGQVVSATSSSEFADGIAWVEIAQEPSGVTGWVAATGPEGSPWLAVVRDGPIGVTSGEDAELVDPVSGERSALTSGIMVADLEFAPDGERVALITPLDESRVVPIDVVTLHEPKPEPTGPVFGPPAMVWPAFAPNGEAVAFLQGQNFLDLALIWVGEGEAPVFPFPLTAHPVSWSPDSRRIAGTEWVNALTGDPEIWEIFVAEEGMSQATRLTNRGGVNVTPAWSPDGSTIAFLHDSGQGRVALELMNSDGSDRRTLFTFDASALSAAQPAWSPDGSRIAVAQQLDGSPAVIHLVDARTSEHLSIPTTAERCDELTWSPSGSRIAFVCGPADGSAPQSALMATVGEPGITDLGPAWHLDWARTLEPIVAD